MAAKLTVRASGTELSRSPGSRSDLAFAQALRHSVCRAVLGSSSQGGVIDGICWRRDSLEDSTLTARRKDG